MPRSPWVPGMPSPNPAGRAVSAPVEVRDYARRFTLPAMRTLVQIMNHADKDSDKIKAANAILDRAWGKPVQSVDFLADGANGALLQQIAEAHSQAIEIAGSSPMAQIPNRTEEIFEPSPVKSGNSRKRIV